MVKSNMNFTHWISFFLLGLFIHFSLLPIVSPADLKSDTAALLALRTSLKGFVLPWNNTVTPCNWRYVKCASNRVTELHLPGRSLVGSIPTGTLGNLTALVFLSLRYNVLTGSLPADLSSCTQLQYIYLQESQISGEIPSVLFTLPNLTRLVLSGNNLTGEIPVAFNNLTRLATLLLENNQLNGSIPELNLPSLEQFNVSNNLLNGSIPEKLSRFPSSAFEGNSLCGSPLAACPGTEGSTSGVNGNNKKKKNKLSGGAIAGIVIAAVVVLIAVIFCLILLCRRKSKDKNNTRELAAVAAAKRPDVEMAGEREKSVPETAAAVAAPTAAAKGAAAKTSTVSKSLTFVGNAPRVYDLDDLLRASAEVLGKGTYGTTYKAQLDSGIAVAVKRLKDVTVPEQELKEKIEEVGRMDHENLVPLRAYHFSGNERLLVLDYMPVGSLSALLHGNRGGSRTPLNWETRSMIALGAARGVTYIHSRSSTSSHGNIKSSNILLSSSFEARVSDFGLAQLASPSVTPNRVTGYRAPEVTDPRKVSQKADVYSFGVFLLELLTAKAPLLNDEGIDLPRWVQSVVKEEWAAEVFDMELLRYQNVEEEMVQLLQLALDCCTQYPDNRPSMEDVTNRIEQICGGSTSEKDQGGEGDIVSAAENQ